MIRCLISSSLRLSKKASLEHMRRIRRKRLNGIVMQVYVTSWSIPSYELLVFINATTRLTCSFLQEGQTSYTFFTTKETREITNYISCHSKNLIYLIQCKKCHCQYIGETKRQLNERFGEHRRSILNHHQLNNPTPVSLHFNQPGHSINDVHLIPLELMRSTRDSVRKAREAHLINKAKTLHPLGINRRDEAHQGRFVLQTKILGKFIITFQLF